MANNSFVELSSPQFQAAHSKADLVRVKITLADLSSGRVGAVVDQLMQLSDTREAVLRWKNKLIIGVEKRPDDHRDVSEIPEVVHYFRALTNHWPFWMHYVEKDCGTLGAVLRLLIGTERLRRADGQEHLVLTDADAVRAQSKWLYGRMKYLYRCHAMSGTDDTDMAMAITRAVNAMFQKT